MEPDDVLYKEKFVWNRQKNILNTQKHHISFETASLVFEDPFLYETWDAENSFPGEDRFIVTGSVTGFVNSVLVTVSVTYRADLIRIISARAADPAERKAYYEEIGKYLDQG